VTIHNFTAYSTSNAHNKQRTYVCEQGPRTRKKLEAGNNGTIKSITCNLAFQNWGNYNGNRIWHTWKIRQIKIHHYHYVFKDSGLMAHFKDSSLMAHSGLNTTILKIL
jgi:hypothetical protein